jgi:hypothetical protein
MVCSITCISTSSNLERMQERNEKPFVYQE